MRSGGLGVMVGLRKRSCGGCGQYVAASGGGAKEKMEEKEKGKSMQDAYAGLIGRAAARDVETPRYVALGRVDLGVDSSCIRHEAAENASGACVI